jgi:hypothetical protein
LALLLCIESRKINKYIISIITWLYQTQDLFYHYGNVS